MQIAGHYTDGVSSARKPAELLLRAGRLELSFADGSAPTLLGHAALSASDRLSGVPRRIRWGTDATFVTTEDDAVDELLRQLGRPVGGKALARAESHWGLAVVALVAVVALLGVLLIWGVPWGARQAAHAIPDNIGRASAQQTLNALDRTLLAPSELSEERQSVLRDYLLAHDSVVQRVVFRAGGDDVGANAFALPGAWVVITDELVEGAASDAEILAVYLHEVGHAAERHAETSALQSAAWVVLLTLLSGDMTGVSEVLASVPGLLAHSAFSRDLEREADGFALAALEQHGLNPSLLAVALERLAAADGQATRAEPTRAEPARVRDWQAYVATHPGIPERAARARAAARTSGYDPLPAPSLPEPAEAPDP